VGAVVVYIEERQMAKLTGKASGHDVIGEDRELGIGISRYVSINK